ncbi:hypothetical protein CVIRNUC_007186 [Coccomyxa viridis]|uniref:Uncharacterized protein n=1 Tax=Coccomyxa viridis TaxID=1274662 RepID=A0AAV1I9V1_9CHLO|nr:hypothetical protein CVIRNUC_007186 [Coccomyxa viridis]
MAVLDIFSSLSAPAAKPSSKAAAPLEQSPPQPAVLEVVRAEDVTTLPANARTLLPKPCRDTSFLSLDFALFTETMCWEA